MQLLMAIEKEPPYYYAYSLGADTVYRFETPEHGTSSFLRIGHESGQLDFFASPNASKRSVIDDLNMAVMLGYTYRASLEGRLLMHASVIEYKGSANLFLGMSGTGKSTHSRLWLENVGGCSLVNDDNPVLGIEPDGIFVYGSPWSGKTPCYRNIRVKVHSIVRLEQSQENKAQAIKGLKAYASLLPSISNVKWLRSISDAISGAAEKVISTTDCYILSCRPDADAVRTILAAIYRK